MHWQFAYPWILAFTCLVPAVWASAIFRYKRTDGMMTSVPDRVLTAGNSLRTLSAWVPHFILSFSIVLLIIATARPQKIIGHTETTKDTIAIELVVDRSGSMEEEVVFNSQRTTRLEAVKEVLELFVQGNGHELKGRTGDLLGLIVFGSFADTLMPLTQSHKALVESLRRIELPRIERERSTAIGDALMLAAARLKASEDAFKNESDDPEFQLKSKAIVLLTDGENRAGRFSPAQAAEIAKEWGIKVYIIGIRGGTSSGGMFFGAGLQEVNDEKMTLVAEHTGGLYFGVDRVEDLIPVYAQIDELERSTIQTSDSTSFEELYPPFALASGILYACFFILKHLVYRSVTG